MKKILIPLILAVCMVLSAMLPASAAYVCESTGDALQFQGHTYRLFRFLSSSLNGLGMFDNHDVTECIEDGNYNADVNGKTYSDATQFDASLNAASSYSLNQRYDSMSGYLFVPQVASEGKDIWIKVYGDDQLLMSIEGIKNEDAPRSFGVNLSGVTTMRIETGNQGSYSCGFLILANIVLRTADGKKVPDLWDGEVTLENAEKFCEKQGGHLATISSQEENDALYQYILSLDCQSAYIGLCDAGNEGDWKWANGEDAAYTNWHSGEPNGGTGENYAMFYYKFSDGTWNDGGYDNGAFLCEWDNGVTPTPKPTPTPTPKPKQTFKDVKKDAYYAEPVQWAVEKGITNGTSETTFSPNAQCTRAQVVTFLWRANGSPKAKGSNPFKDVKKTDYFYDAVLWAVANGITNGTSATGFSPSASCTRGQVVTFQWRSNNAAKATAKNPFKDVQTKAYYYDAVLWAVNRGVTNGTSKNTFSPSDTCTRGQVVTFLYRDIVK